MMLSWSWSLSTHTEQRGIAISGKVSSGGVNENIFLFPKEQRSCDHAGNSQLESFSFS